MVYDDQISSFQELFDKDIPFQYTVSLVIEMFKVINNIAANIIEDLFATYHTQNLSLLFQVCAQFITVEILYSITVPLSGI